MENQEKYDRKLPITVKMGFGIQSVDGVAAIVRPVGMSDGDYCYTFSLN